MVSFGFLLPLIERDFSITFENIVNEARPIGPSQISLRMAQLFINSRFFRFEI